MKTVLSVFAHADDEISAVGTLANHSARGDRVVMAWLTVGTMTSALEGSDEEKAQVRREHAKRVTELVGAEMRILNFRDAEIYPSREASLEVSELIREIKPNILITWNQFWATGIGHPDHRYTGQITLDAVSYARYNLKESKFPPYRDFISIYLSPAKPDSEFTTVYVDISHQGDLIRKFVDIYSGMYLRWDAYKMKMADALMNGRRMGCELAEAFDIVQKASSETKYLE